MRNKKFQILEIWHFSASFSQVYLGNGKRQKNPLTFYQKLSTQSIQQQKNTYQNWMKSKYYTFQICKISEFETLLHPFEIN